MHISRIILLLLMSLSLLACSSSPFMDDYLSSIESRESYVFFEHSDFGIKSNQQVPLSQEFDRCTESVMGGISLGLGGQTVSNISVLERVNQDYHAFLLELVMSKGAGDNGAFSALYNNTITTQSENGELKRHAFAYTEELEQPLKKLTRLILKRNQCLARSGWIYKRLAP